MTMFSRAAVRRWTGLGGMLAGIGLVVAARTAVGQPAHPQPMVVLPAGTSAPATSASGAPPTGSSTTQAAPAGPKTVDGNVVDTPYGPVQVAVVFNGGKIVDVRNLQTPTDANRSIRLAALATPILRQEVLSAQSAQVDSVSGATYTSEGYAQSVQYAIDHR